MIPNRSDIEESKKLTDLKLIKIRFDYPFEYPITLGFKRNNGWTEGDLYEAVVLGYKLLYAENDGEDVSEFTEEIIRYVDEDKINAVEQNLDRENINVPQGFYEGKHGIWGHGIEDLVFEGYRKISEGVYTPEIGS